MKMENVRLFLVASIVALMLITCDKEEDNKIAPPELPQPAAISFTSAEGVLQGYIGQTDSLITTALVVDEEQNGIPNQTVVFSIVTGRGTIKKQNDFTDSFGQIQAIYNFVYASYPETTVISARVKNLEATVSIAINPRPVRIMLHPNQHYFEVPYGESCSVEFTVYVRNEGDIGVAGIPVEIEKVAVNQWDEEQGEYLPNDSLDVFLAPLNKTGLSGVAESTLFIPTVQQSLEIVVRSSIILPSPPKSGLDKEIAIPQKTFGQHGKSQISPMSIAAPEFVGESVLADTDTVYIYTSGIADFHLSLYADPEIIQSGSEDAHSRIFGLLLDREYNGVANDTIFVAATLGFIVSRVVTDAAGYFETIFYGVGDPVDEELPVSITAIYRKNGLTLAQNSVIITIMPPPQVGSVKLYTPSGVGTDR